MKLANDIKLEDISTENVLQMELGDHKCCGSDEKMD